MKMFKGDKHICTIPPKEDILVTYISDGCCVILRRKFKKLFMINEDSVYVKSCFKSSFLIEREKRNHLKHHYFMIHPFSKAVKYWNIFMLYIVFLSMFKFGVEYRYYNDNMQELFCVFFMFMDIIRIFCTGVYREAFTDTIFERSKVAKKYVKGWFFVDIFTIIPVLKTKNTQLNYARVVAIFFQVSRLVKFLFILNAVQKERRLKIYIFKALRLLLISVLIIMWITYAVYSLVSVHKEKWVTNDDDLYREVAARCFNYFFLFGVPSKPSSHPSTLFLEILILHIGYCFYIYSSIQFIQIMKLFNTSTNTHQLLKSRLLLYADSKNMPNYLKYKFIQSYEHKFHRTYYDEKLIMDTVSGQLKKELVEFGIQQFLTKISAISLIPKEKLVDVIQNLRQTIYVIGDHVSRAKMKGKTLYFIYTGSVAVYRDNKEIAHLFDGDVFGEISSYTKQVTIHSVIAIATCKIYTITIEALSELLYDYPDVLPTLVKYASDTIMNPRK